LVPDFGETGIREEAVSPAALVVVVVEGDSGGRHWGQRGSYLAGTLRVF